MIQHTVLIMTSEDQIPYQQIFLVVSHKSSFKNSQKTVHLYSIILAKLSSTVRVNVRVGMRKDYGKGLLMFYSPEALYPSGNSATLTVTVVQASDLTPISNLRCLAATPIYAKGQRSKPYTNRGVEPLRRSCVQPDSIPAAPAS